jgi:hypothetical protein
LVFAGAWWKRRTKGAGKEETEERGGKSKEPQSKNVLDTVWLAISTVFSVKYTPKLARQT